MPPELIDDPRVERMLEGPYYKGVFHYTFKVYETTGRKRRAHVGGSISLTSMLPGKSYAIPLNLMPEALRLIRLDMSRGIAYTMSETPTTTRVFFELDLLGREQAKMLHFYTREISAFCQQFFAPHGGVTFNVSTCEPKLKNGQYYVGAHMVGNHTVEIDTMRDILYAVHEVLMPRLKDDVPNVDLDAVDMAVVRGNSVTLRMNGAYKAINCVICENVEVSRMDCEDCLRRGRVLHKVAYFASYQLSPKGERTPLDPMADCSITSLDPTVSIAFPSSYPRHVQKKDRRRIKGQESMHLRKQGVRLASVRKPLTDMSKVDAFLKLVRTSFREHRVVNFRDPGMTSNGGKISCYLRGDGCKFCPTKGANHSSNNVSVCADRKTRKVYYSCGNAACAAMRETQKTFTDIPFGTFTVLFPDADGTSRAVPRSEASRKHQRKNKRPAQEQPPTSSLGKRTRLVDDNSRQRAADFMDFLSQTYDR